jgi:hypothetical protein
MDLITLATTVTTFLSSHINRMKKEAIEDTDVNLLELNSEVWDAIMAKFQGILLPRWKSEKIVGEVAAADHAGVLAGLRPRHGVA